jgi:UDP-N-acetylglucosamine acyltransferase
MADIHASAVVDPRADIGADVVIGPGCVVGPHVTIAEGCCLVGHVHVAGHTTIGPRTRIAPFASLGGFPQSTRYSGEPTRLIIGADCDIREGATMNVGTKDGGGVTRVGDRGFFMVYAHVGHDCQVGNDVIFANGATLAGHVVVGDFVFIGGISAVHQRVRIGPHAMIGGNSGLRGDVIPFGLASGSYAALGGLNIVGLRRRKFPREQVHALRRAYRDLFSGPGTLAARLDRVEAEFNGDAAVAEVVAFIRTAKDRPLCLPGSIQGH